jgi:cytochrome c oxidase subunit 1
VEATLWQHLFVLGHPEVYIMILPAMGIASDILNFLAQTDFRYHAMAAAMVAIGFLGFIVWGHHMFQSGMNPMLGMSFMFSTMVIAVPSAIKTFNWLGTLWGGSIRFTTPMLNALAFVLMFVIGGLSGIYMASTPVDIFIHDTYFM